MSKKAAAIGVDIGGGTFKLGVVDAAGKILKRDSFKTAEHKGRSAQLDRLVQSIGLLRKWMKNEGIRLAGVGVGAPGPVDVGRGFVYFFPNIHGWKNTPLSRRLSKRLGVPVAVDNDANAMALAEFRFGAGRGCRNAIALTLGTGIGGGLLLNGELFHGTTYSAAEIGHLIIDENGPQCACGNRGCVEAFVGTHYFVRRVRTAMRGRKTILKKWLSDPSKVLSPHLVALAAKKGDSFSKAMWSQTGGHLGTALAGLVNILNPEKIILGGGIAQNGAILFDPVIRTIVKKSFPVAGRSVKVVPAFFGADAGVIGAAALVLKNAKQSKS